MARTTHVKKAQQRYETKPVLDEQGNPIKIALTKADGSPKTTSAKKGSRPIFITKTERDLTRPKPNYTCGKCGTEILPGMPYKWIKPKSGPYGGRMMVRCGPCPGWNVWDYSSSLSAQVARIEHDADLTGVESVEDAQGVAEAAADAIRELAEQKRESASNIEDGFGHATYQSEELEQQADDLDTWADEVAETEFPDPEDSEYQEDATCEACGGDGQEDNPDWDEDEAEDPDYSEPEQIDCAECDGSGEKADLETDWDVWRDAAEEALGETLGACPV